MSEKLNKDAVRLAFDKAAPQYDGFAGLQQDIACRLLDLCKQYVDAPQQALDVGTGTGYGVRLLQRHYPDSQIIGSDFSYAMLKQCLVHRYARDKACFVCADGDQLPFQDGMFDLIYSSSFVQWSADLQAFLAQAKGLLRAKGSLLFSSYGPQTLFELRESWRAVDQSRRSHTLSFESAENLVKTLEANRFVVDSCRRAVRVIHHRSVLDALNSLKMIGAQTYPSDSSEGLVSRGHFKRMTDYYEQHFGVHGLVPTSYEIVLVAAHVPD